ncbi:hypothetical protein PR202_gn00788 [Eleusine coracana subsp. coracana]|uniref:NAD(P)-binding Rossmann-fold superfamily protein n=1 Tax=Eleusine coracana subsp. coracana TaxID=191504 RepID=A0AAV5G731_ELECO|nr:hypothetical protein PR202_gn00788 [Eleusine coracana subsp. coracana]
MTAAAAACLHWAPSPSLSHGCCVSITSYPSTSSSCSWKRGPTARPARLLPLVRRAPVVAASLGISHDKGSEMSGTNIVGHNDLLIVGPGVLGRIVAEKWQKVRKWKSEVESMLISYRNIQVVKFLARLQAQIITVIACVSLICNISSSAKYVEQQSQIGVVKVLSCSHQVLLCLTATTTDRATRIVHLSQLAGALTLMSFLKLKMLFLMQEYHISLTWIHKIDRGAHTFWLRKGTLDSRPDHIVNQIHYEDAASLAIAIMKKRPRGRIFLGCDNKPLSRQEIMDSVNKSGKFDTKFEGFTGTDGPLGKRMENSKTRDEIGWEPKYPSFTEFLGLSS